MQVTALVIAIVAAVAIIGLGTRFILSPQTATRDYGVAPGNVRALTEIKGIRDITSGVVVLAVGVGAGTTALGWALTAAALTAFGDAIIVRANDGKLRTAVGIHGVTAVVLVAAGLVLALG